MIYMCGDLHGSIEIPRLVNLVKSKRIKGKKENNFLIILGDFGLVWELYPSTPEKYWLNWLTKRNWITLFVDGNHENFDRLNKLKIIDKFGGKVGKVNNSVFHLRRGEIYDIENKSFFVMGGAASIDKHYRCENITWWSQEIPSEEEFEKGIYNLSKRDWIVDYILGHTGPNSIIDIYLKQLQSHKVKHVSYKIEKYFDYICEKTIFTKFYFAHWHNDWASPCKKYIMLYNNILRLGD